MKADVSLHICLSNAIGGQGGGGQGVGVGGGQGVVGVRG